MSLKLYADLLSQPSRAIALFMKVNRIPHEFKNVSIMRGEHKSPEYVEKVHPFGKVPAIQENGTSMTESIAIVRYLARKYQVADNWYPKDMLGQAKVDEFLEWHHLGLRMPLSSFFLLKFVRPMLTGKQPKEDQVKFWTNRMNTALDEVENIWLKNNPYLTGSMISVADLFGICEIEQPRMSNFDPTENRPRLTKWMKRVREELEPHYSEVMKPVNDIINQTQSKL